MAPKSLPILFTFLSILVVALPAFAASRGGLVGSYKPIPNPNDPEVVKAAKFAVTEHNKEAKSSLNFEKVVSGESQVVSGTNYRLVISATDGGASKTYKALVYDKPWQNILQLVSFEEIKA